MQEGTGPQIGDEAGEEAARAMRAQGFDPSSMPAEYSDPAHLEQVLDQFRFIMSTTSGPVNWGLVEGAAKQQAFSAGDPRPSASEAAAAKQAMTVADLWLDTVTDFSGGPAERQAWSRAQWIDATLPMWKRICEPVAANVSRALSTALEDQMGGGGDLPAGVAAMLGQTQEMMPKLSAMMFAAQIGRALSALAQEAALWLAGAGGGMVLSTHSPGDGGLEPLLSARFPAVRTRAPLRTRPDVMVTVDAHVVEPLLARRLVQEDIAHLPVVVGEAGVRVGPLLGAGGPCSTCLNLWERDADPCWPALATQMRTLPMPEVEHLVLHEAAASTARAVIDTLIGQESRGNGTQDETEPGGEKSEDSAAWWSTHSVEVTGQEPRGRQRTWERHPECLCSQL